MFLDDHHDDGHLAIWCAAPDGVQTEMVETEPERFFRPPYVGHRGWLGVELAEVSAVELTAICREAFLTVAPPTSGGCSTLSVPAADVGGSRSTSRAWRRC